MEAFDIISLAPGILPDEYKTHVDGRTTTFACTGRTFKITSRGTLEASTGVFDEVPEENRPYFGTTIWGDPAMQRIGATTERPGKVFLAHHGSIEFRLSKSDGSESVDFVARFEAGKIQSIDRIDDDD